MRPMMNSANSGRDAVKPAQRSAVAAGHLGDAARLLREDVGARRRDLPALPGDGVLGNPVRLAGDREDALDLRDRMIDWRLAANVVAPHPVALNGRAPTALTR